MYNLYEIPKEEHEEIKKIFKFLETSSLNAKALIANEILMLTEIKVFEDSGKYVGKVESLGVEGKSLQLKICDED